MTSSAPNAVAAPNLAQLLGPFLPALPAAAVSTSPAIGVLPLLSPILRQRVQLLSASSNEPWLRLLCYDSAKAAQLADITRSGRLEPHPVSGEVEVDWDYDAQTAYRRLDVETLQALVVLEDLGLTFQLIYCIGDEEGGGDGWRVGEVSVADKPAPFAAFGGKDSLAAAEKEFAESSESKPANGTPVIAVPVNGNGTRLGEPLYEEEADGDGYWDRYDATPSRTPARSPETARSPAPAQSAAQFARQEPYQRSSSAEDAYYSRYDNVQPAMDNHDPDEEVEHIEIAPPPPPPLGLAAIQERNEHGETTGAWTLAEREKSPSVHDEALLHPRPESSASSNGSRTVEKLEETAGKQEQNEFGVKQHVSRSIRSLFMLARASGIDRDEFDQLVKGELDVLRLVEHDM